MNKHKKALQLNFKVFCKAFLLLRTGNGGRTRTRFNSHRILSPACLPIPPSRQKLPKMEVISYENYRDFSHFHQKWKVYFFYLYERKTGFEPATSTLARSRSTSWATFAYYFGVSSVFIFLLLDIYRLKWCKGKNFFCTYKFYLVFFLSFLKKIPNKLKIKEKNLLF